RPRRSQGGAVAGHGAHHEEAAVRVADRVGRHRHPDPEDEVQKQRQEEEEHDGADVVQLAGQVDGHVGGSHRRLSWSSGRAAAPLVRWTKAFSRLGAEIWRSWAPRSRRRTMARASESVVTADTRGPLRSTRVTPSNSAMAATVAAR